MPKVLDPLTDADNKDLAKLKHHWDRMQFHKQAYNNTLEETARRLSPVQISNFTGLKRQRIESQLKRMKR